MCLIYRFNVPNRFQNIQFRQEISGWRYMELAEAMPLLTENHTAVAITVNKAGNPQSTVVTTGMVDGKLCWISRGRTIKVKNIERTGRATVTVLNLVTRRYVTVEGTAIISHWPEETDEIDDHVKLLKEVYIAMDRSPSQSDFEFSETMKEEKRTVISITPEFVYGSLTQR